MANAEERMARALEGIERHNRDLAKVLTTLNQNFVTFVEIVTKFAEEEQAHHPSEKCPTCGLMYCKACETDEDPNQIVIPNIGVVDVNRNAVSHTSEFNNPEHRLRATWDKDGAYNETTKGVPEGYNIVGGEHPLNDPYKDGA
jgi:hypothetical protein